VADLPDLELQCFGPPAARVQQRFAGLGQKHLALLVYLALSPGRSRTRGHLRGALWPHANESRARHSLNEAVSQLRAELGTQRLVTEGDSLTLAEIGLEVDALRFSAMVETQPAEALKLAQGDFLEGFGLTDAPAFEEWSDQQRARYRARIVEAFLTIGEQALTACRYTDALEAAGRAAALASFSEPAASLQMRGAALAGDVAGALAAFHAFEGRLRAELEETPSRELTALAERIRGGRWIRSGRSQVHADPPLVGREAVHSTAFALMGDGAPSGPCALLITGDPGVGKSRLLRECAKRLALAGAVIVVTRPLPSDQDAPFSTLRSLLRAGLLTAPGSAAAPPGSLGILGALAPELAGSTIRPPSDTAEVAAALAAVFGAVADEQPLCLGVDEAHCADGPSVEALAAAISQSKDLPVVLIVTSSDSSKDLPRELERLRAEVGWSVPGAAVHLAAFSETEIRALVDQCAPWCLVAADRERLARRVFLETGGNPFLAVTLLRGLDDASALRVEVLQWPPPGATTGSPLPISVPSLARRAIVARVVQLDDDTRQVVRTASIGGLAIDPELVTTLSGLSRAAVDEKLAALERHGLVVFEATRYVFAAPLIAQVVSAEWLLPGERHALRQRAAEELAGRADLESRLLRIELLSEILPGSTSFDEAVQVAADAVVANMPRSARRAISAAARSVLPNDEPRRRKLEALQAQSAS
jgi:DNA-binding SARP family transcriptional activator